MKQSIHPKSAVVKATCSVCGSVYTVRTTIGKDFSISTCSQCHPTYTGNYEVVHATTQVEKFLQRQKKAASLKKK